MQSATTHAAPGADGPTDVHIDLVEFGFSAPFTQTADARVLAERLAVHDDGLKPWRVFGDTITQTIETTLPILGRAPERRLGHAEVSLREAGSDACGGMEGPSAIAFRASRIARAFLEATGLAPGSPARPPRHHCDFRSI